MEVKAINQTKTLADFSFYLSVSNKTPELVSVDGKMRVPLASLDASGLVRAKNLAHNQYIQAMMNDSDDLGVHRATLNFLCKAIERSGIAPNRPHNKKANPAPSRKMTSKIERRINRKMAV